MTALDVNPTVQSPATRVRRVEVYPKPGQPDPAAEQYLNALRQRFGEHASLDAARVYLIESQLDDDSAARIAQELLADPVSQDAVIGVRDANAADHAVVEVHYLPGVMDPVAQSTADAILDMIPGLSADTVEVRTGWRFNVRGVAASGDELIAFAKANMANTVIQAIHNEPYWPGEFLHGQAYTLHVTHVPIRELDEEGLKKLSRDGHLFLSLEEMLNIRAVYRAAGREPTDIELETLAQTWSEHCVHKTLKATIRYKSEIRNPRSEINFADREGHEINEDGSVTIRNLLKSTIAAATRKLMETPPHDRWCISVFEDNAGIVRFDDEDGVCIKVETHNHPSAIEPYGGAATGVGGCIRDVIGTGLAAKPIANTDVFCVAHPCSGRTAPGEGATESPLPKGVIAPRRILERVVAGVRDYGNRMGIPTVNGAVWFHDDYLGNPLVYCGCVGLIPLDKCFGSARPGDRIIVLGGRTGRDGIHGATFSSAELTDSHADEFSHAVQIGNAITEKKMLDVILRARDHRDGCLYNAITDCGAGGFSSAVGEMGEKVGAFVRLENAPLKYQGLSYTEIWISEAQERMVLAVPPEKVDTLAAMCDAENVEMCDLGHFGHSDNSGNPDDPIGEPTLMLTYQGREVGRLPMGFLHDGIPTPTREAVWGREATERRGDEAAEGEGPEAVGPSARETPSSLRPSVAPSLSATLSALLSHPNIASKHWIVRQYDHEVQGGSVVKPLVGPAQDGPSDAAVLRPKLSSDRGVALGCGLAPNLCENATKHGYANDGDSYWATLAAIDEAVRNVVCVGADPTRIAILDNFCWPSCDDPHQLGALVRAAEACYDGALAYRTPFVSGKDSLNNQFKNDATGEVITIPQTLLITALGIVPDVSRCVTMDAKAAGNVLLLVGETTDAMGGSHLLMTGTEARPRLRHEGTEGFLIRNASIPRIDLTVTPRTAAAVAKLIAAGHVVSAHDCSDGGLLVAAAEMAFAGRIGLDLDLSGVASSEALDPIAACFAETPGRYLLEVPPRHADAALRALRDADIPFGHVGTFAAHDRLTVRTPQDGRMMDESLDDLRVTWLRPLDW